MSSPACLPQEAGRWIKKLMTWRSEVRLQAVKMIKNAAWNHKVSGLLNHLLPHVFVYLTREIRLWASLWNIPLVILTVSVILPFPHLVGFYRWKVAKETEGCSFQIWPEINQQICQYGCILFSLFSNGLLPYLHLAAVKWVHIFCIYNNSPNMTAFPISLEWKRLSLHIYCTIEDSMPSPGSFRQNTLRGLRCC